MVKVSSPTADDKAVWNLKCFAVDLLISSTRVSIPRLVASNINNNGALNVEEKAFKAQTIINYEKAVTGNNRDGIKLDAVIELKGHFCGINIVVIGNERGYSQTLAKPTSISLFEIHVDPHCATTMSQDEMKAYILHDAPRYWVHNEKLKQWEQRQSNIGTTYQSSVKRTGVLHQFRKNKTSTVNCSVTEIVSCQISLLALNSVHQCQSCNLISTSSQYCSHCFSKNLAKIKTSRLSKSKLEHYVQKLYRGC